MPDSVDPSQVAFARQEGFAAGVIEGKKQALAVVNDRAYDTKTELARTILQTRPQLDGDGVVEMGTTILAWVRSA